MTRSEVSEGGEGFQVQKVPTNILNKQTCQVRLNAEGISLLVEHKEKHRRFNGQ